MELKRYRQTASGAVFGDENGRWCFYEDAAAEIARLKARVAELEKFEASMRCPNCDNLRLEIGQLRRRVAELEEAADCIQCERDGLKQAAEFWKSAAEAQRGKNCDECVRIAEGKMVAKLQAREAELEAMLHDIIDSIPSTYDEEDPTVKRHAAALNVAWNSLKEVGHDG